MKILFITIITLSLIAKISIQVTPPLSEEEKIEKLARAFLYGSDPEMRDMIYQLKNNTHDAAVTLEKMAAVYHEDSNLLKEAGAYTGAIYWYNQGREYEKASELSIAAIPLFEQVALALEKDHQYVYAVDYYEYAGDGYNIMKNIPKAHELYNRGAELCVRVRNRFCMRKMEIRLDSLYYDLP